MKKKIKKNKKESNNHGFLSLFCCIAKTSDSSIEKVHHFFWLFSISLTQFIQKSKEDKKRVNTNNFFCSTAKLFSKIKELQLKQTSIYKIYHFLMAW